MFATNRSGRGIVNPIHTEAKRQDQKTRLHLKNAGIIVTAKIVHNDELLRQQLIAQGLIKPTCQECGYEELNGQCPNSRCPRND